MSNSSTDIQTTAVGKTQPSVLLSFCIVALCKHTSANFEFIKLLNPLLNVCFLFD